ncbi:hypothetical protein ABW21_db0206522 [Orbilia brochopaga]|nr:hypothetical protein ABW21_db0206522 [Drechslerella brochopaga]
MMKNPDREEGIPLSDYQDALNKIPGHIKQAHPNFEWDSGQGKMTWASSAGGSGSAGTTQTVSRKLLYHPNELHLGHPWFIRQGLSMSDQVEFLGKLRDAGLRTGYQPREPYDLYGPDIRQDDGPAWTISGSLGLGLGKVVWKRSRYDVPTDGPDAGNSPAHGKQIVEGGSPHLSQKNSDIDSDRLNGDQFSSELAVLQWLIQNSLEQLSMRGLAECYLHVEDAITHCVRHHGSGTWDLNFCWLLAELFLSLGVDSYDARQ